MKMEGDGKIGKLAWLGILKNEPLTFFSSAIAIPLGIYTAIDNFKEPRA
jgi:hypothetical protein